MDDEKCQEKNEEKKTMVEEPNEEIDKSHIRVPYLQWLIQQNIEKDQEFLELFKQVKINIPLIEAIQRVLAYSKYIKDLLTVKRKSSAKKKAYLANQVSSIINHELPPKFKDPGIPTILCIIGDYTVNRALLDLEASVNLLLYSVYKQLG